MAEPAAVDEFHLARARSVAVLGRAATAAGVGVLALVTVPLLLPAGALIGGVFSSATGWWSLRSVVDTPPMATLRGA